MTQQRLYLTAAALAAVALLAYGARNALDRPPAWQARAGSAKRLAVVPFATGASIEGWTPAVFAESLAVKLNANPAVDARVGGVATQADFSLEGDLAMNDGHAVIALRLVPAGQRAASWSATFWRDKLLDPKLAADLAERVAEALGVARVKPDSTPTQFDSMQPKKEQQ